MTLVGITQRITEESAYNERRSALDVRWYDFLKSCDLTPLILPNDIELVQKLVKSLNPAGFILTGGNTVSKDAPERDKAEGFLLEYAAANSLPILGVCRGMQFMHVNAGGKLEKISNHVKSKHLLDMNGHKINVNSFHDEGFKHVAEPYYIIAKAQDGVVEAMKHKNLNWFAQMWHPEREKPFQDHDIMRFKEMFS